MTLDGGAKTFVCVIPAKAGLHSFFARKWIPDLASLHSASPE